MSRRGLAAASAGVALAGIAPMAGTSASAVPRCAVPATTVIRAVPWAQRALAPSRAWMLTRGGGIVVGVVDTGVSATAPALAGLVLPGRDVTTNGAANTDCTGHGTFVAGLLAAKPVGGSGLQGIAPGVRVLPIRVTADEAQVTPVNVATGIRAAVDGGARVIAVAVSVPTAPTALRAAIAYAAAHDVLVVASTDATAQSTSGGPSYPAALPGVVAVASIQSDGKAVSSRGTGTPAALAAPGADLLSIAPRGSGNVVASGSGVAVAFVAGAAALVRDYRPFLKAAAVRHRLEATADHPTGHLPDPLLGYGTVDPVAAVTTALPEESGETPPEPHAGQIEVVLPTPQDRHPQPLALITSIVVPGCAALGGLMIAMIGRGRRRGWRAADES
jgi:membrane-anchored mycosin MYCP